MTLIGGAPALYVPCAVRDDAVEVLDNVGRLQAVSELLAYPESVQRKGFLQTFRQACSRLWTRVCQLCMDRVQCGTGFCVRFFLPRGLQSHFERFGLIFS